MAQRFDADSLRRLICDYADLLAAHEDEINALNVFPVADGDTGTNMLLTVQAVVDSMADVETTLPELAGAARRAVLMSARGSSGIIFSQWLRALLADLDEAEASPATLARAFESAADAAYGAVEEPAEGTILTVARSVADAAQSATGSFEELWTAAQTTANDTLARTPELLPVLRRAGVVDSGARALTLLFDAARGVEPPVVSGTSVEGGRGAAIHAPGTKRNYEVTFMLDAPTAAPLLERWETLGDAIVVAGEAADGGWRCHIHTDNPAAAIETGIESGRPYRLGIEELPDTCDLEQLPTIPVAEACTGVVAVAVGAGIVARMRELGAVVVQCDRTMNASTGEVAEAIAASIGDAVVVLPNDPDTLPACEAAAELTERPTDVLATASLAEGLACLERHDPMAAAHTDLATMRDGLSQPWAEIAEVVRDAETSAGSVRLGEWIGIDRTGIVNIAARPIDAALSMLEALGPFATLEIYPGSQASSELTDELVGMIQAMRPEADVILREGGQPYSAWLMRST